MKPWLIKSSAYVRPRFRVDQCELPNGKPLEALVMEFRSWANVMALTKDEKVVLARQYRHGARMDFLEFPGGIIEDGEDPEAGARRELLEETGYKVETMIETGVLYPNPAFQTNRLYCYLALGAEKAEAQNLDDGEDIEVELVSLDELLDLCRAGKFQHALDAAVLFQALLHLKRVI